MKTVNWKPHQHRILVHVEEVKEHSEGGIYLPDEARLKEQNQQVLAEVIEVGPTAEVDEEVIKPGTRVMIARWGGATIPGKDNKLFRVINDEDINAVEIE